MDKEVNSGAGLNLAEVKFRGLLNKQNMDLWNELNREYTIELDEGPEEGYLTYFNDEVVVIEVDMANISPAAFTHELLHVYLKARGVQIIWDLKEIINGDNDLGEVISTSLRVHMGNCLEHVKMLPIFLSLGFRNEDFILDYKKKILDEEQMLDLKRAFRQNSQAGLGMVDKYIGKFFAMKASNNPDFDYSLLYEQMEELDCSLYRLNQNFWDAWGRYEIGEPKEKYISFLSDYLDGLKSWKKAFSIDEGL